MAILDINQMLPNHYVCGPHRPRILLRYHGIDAFIVKVLLANRVITMITLDDPIAPNAAQRFIKDSNDSNIDFENMDFIVLDQLGSVVEHLPHALMPNTCL